MRSVEGDPMVWPYPRDVILYARSSYFYNYMFFYIPFSDIILILFIVVGFSSEKLQLRLPLRFVMSYSHHI